MVEPREPEPEVLVNGDLEEPFETDFQYGEEE
jgi:hypothetical protein